MMTDEMEFEPRKEPSQERSRALVEALVEATARILAAEGADSLTTNRVAEVAGVSIGSLYQYFPNKSALIAALVERELEADVSEVQFMLESSREMPLTEIFKTLVAGIVSSMEGRRTLHAELLPLVDELRRAELVRRRRDEMTSVVMALLDERADELAARLREGEGVAQRRRCAAFVALRGMELAFNAAKTEAPELLDHPEFAEDLVRVLQSLLIDE